MKEFLTKNFSWIIGFVFVGIFALKAYITLKKAKKIDREGIETDAVVSRIEEHWDPETASSSFTTYVEYRDDTGELVESPMALTGYVPYAEGQRVRIRFIPGDRKMVRIAE
ncbi:MAG: hypothetical protein IJL71_06115 [Oscillospiraceae bacterium]|nr:hypothetical protein [Oscillospiraceae bacterium]